MRVQVKPELLRWARERAGLCPEAHAARFPRLDAWLSGAAQPTMKELEALAKATNTPFGYLFLDKPPVEIDPLPDLRTHRSDVRRRPSPNLLDTIYLCQERQEWFRTWAARTGEEPVRFVGGLSPEAGVEITARTMGDVLGFDAHGRETMRTWAAARRHLARGADGQGVLVMSSATVPGDPTRRLDRVEFGSFAIADPLAPLVFINGNQPKADQMFVLAFELAKLWLGRSGLSDVNLQYRPDDDVDIWCFQVAAELLLPLEIVRAEYDPRAALGEQVQGLARRYKVTPLVALRRIFDLRRMHHLDFWMEYGIQARRLRARRDADDRDRGRKLAAQVGPRFARLLLAAALLVFVLVHHQKPCVKVSNEQDFFDQVLHNHIHIL